MHAVCGAWRRASINAILSSFSLTAAAVHSPLSVFRAAPLSSFSVLRALFHSALKSASALTRSSLSARVKDNVSVNKGTTTPFILSTSSLIVAESP
jgi:hypothetical protein